MDCHTLTLTLEKMINILFNKDGVAACDMDSQPLFHFVITIVAGCSYQKICGEKLNCARQVIRAHKILKIKAS